jgi:NAD(P)-dependent dehydrogenase (short-subunit alcohol dehydrogenase family)
MRILMIGASGTIGRKLVPALTDNHDVIRAGRKGGDIEIDITSAISIKNAFQKLEKIDACVCVAASGPTDDFSTLTEQQLLDDFQGKLFGQVNLVLIGQHYLNDHGSFTLTSGIFADVPYKGVTGGAMISGALHSFVLSASVELPKNIRINVVSPGLVEDSAVAYGHLFPGLLPISMEEITEAYRSSVEDGLNGQIIRLYEPII